MLARLDAAALIEIKRRSSSAGRAGHGVDMFTAAHYRDKAAGFRELAKDADELTAASLIELAEEYEALAARLEPDAEPPMPTIG